MLALLFASLMPVPGLAEEGLGAESDQPRLERDLEQLDDDTDDKKTVSEGDGEPVVPSDEKNEDVETPNPDDTELGGSKDDGDGKEPEPGKTDSDSNAGGDKPGGDEPAPGDPDVDDPTDGDVTTDDPSTDGPDTDDPDTGDDPSGDDPVDQDLVVPALEGLTVEDGGYKISWSPVPGASGYAVYRKVSGGGWAMCATTEQTAYVDKSELSVGKTYLYTVRAYRGDVNTAIANKYDSQYWSDFDKQGRGISALSTPELTSVTASNGRKFSWSAVSGASGYAVYRKPSGGGWAMIGTTTSTSYADNATLSGGKTYYYTVRAFRGDESAAKANKYLMQCWSHFDTKGVSAVALATAKLSGVTSSASGRTVKWSAVSGASGYAVYRKPAGGDWKMIGTTTSKSYTDKSALSAGKAYYYTVRAYKGSVSTAKSHKYSAQYWSYFDSEGVKATYLATPKLSGVTSSASGRTVKWSGVSGASGYAVYRKPSGGDWGIIGTTTSKSYTDKSAASNKRYYYTVRAYVGNKDTALKNKYSSVYWSGYDSKGVTDIDAIQAKMISRANQYSSSTKWLLMADVKNNYVGVFNGKKGSWTQKKYWRCSSGALSTPTPTGTYTVTGKGYSFGHGYTCYYYAQFWGDYLFHSVKYYQGTRVIMDGRLGMNISLGCVRLDINNAKWIYDNIPLGTKVVIYR